MIELALILHLVIFLAAARRLHSVDIYDPPFVLYLCVTVAYFFLLVGDFDRVIDAIDFGELSYYGSSYRTITVNVMLALGFAYTAIRGEKRSDAKSMINKRTAEAGAAEFKKDHQQCSRKAS